RDEAGDEAALEGAPPLVERLLAPLLVRRRARQLDDGRRLEALGRGRRLDAGRPRPETVEPREELEVEAVELFEQTAALVAPELLPEVEDVLLAGLVDLGDDDLVALVLDLEQGGSPPRAAFSRRACNRWA